MRRNCQVARAAVGHGAAPVPWRARAV